MKRLLGASLLLAGVSSIIWVGKAKIFYGSNPYRNDRKSSEALPDVSLKTNDKKAEDKNNATKTEPMPASPSFSEQAYEGWNSKELEEKIQIEQELLMQDGYADVLNSEEPGNIALRAQLEKRVQNVTNLKIAHLKKSLAELESEANSISL